jgi:ankyrin repeat protein
MKGGISPLYISSQNGHFSVVKFLIKNGADVNLLLKNGASPLLIASQHGHFSVVKHLVQKGEANVNQCLANGISALFLSCHNEHFVRKFIIKRSKIKSSSK